MIIRLIDDGKIKGQWRTSVTAFEDLRGRLRRERGDAECKRDGQTKEKEARR